MQSSKEFLTDVVVALAAFLSYDITDLYVIENEIFIEIKGHLKIDQAQKLQEQGWHTFVKNHHGVEHESWKLNINA